MTKKRKILIWAAAAVAFILAVTSPLMVEGWRRKQSFDRSFAIYSRALTEHDFRHAYEMAGPEFRATTSFAEFARQHEELMREKGDFVSVKQGPTVVEGSGTPRIWAAVTTASLTLRNGVVSLTYEFHLEDGEWRLYGVRKD
jgi:hypothetical protein